MARADASFLSGKRQYVGDFVGSQRLDKTGRKDTGCQKLSQSGLSQYFLQELKARYLYPMSTEFGIQGSISPEEVEKKLEEYPDAETVLIASPRMTEWFLIYVPSAGRSTPGIKY